MAEPAPESTERIPIVRERIDSLESQSSYLYKRYADGEEEFYELVQGRQDTKRLEITRERWQQLCATHMPKPVEANSVWGDGL